MCAFSVESTAVAGHGVDSNSVHKTRQKDYVYKGRKEHE